MQEYKFYFLEYQGRQVGRKGVQEPYLTHIPLSSFYNTHQWHIGILVCLSPEQMQSFLPGNHTLKNKERFTYD